MCFKKCHKIISTLNYLLVQSNKNCVKEKKLHDPTFTVTSYDSQKTTDFVRPQYSQSYSICKRFFIYNLIRVNIYLPPIKTKTI